MTPIRREAVAAFVAAEQVRLLQANGLDRFHFYTLKQSRFDVRDCAYFAR